jgi:hypothetical protein
MATGNAAPKDSSMDQKVDAYLRLVKAIPGVHIIGKALIAIQAHRIFSKKSTIGAVFGAYCILAAAGIAAVCSPPDSLNQVLGFLKWLFSGIGGFISERWV